MGDDGDENSSSEERVAEKKYCCGNCPQREAINIARIDIGVAIYEIVCVITIGVVFFVVPDYFQNYVEKNPHSKQLKEFLALSTSLKYGLILLNLVIPIASLILAVMLLIASRAKNVPRLRRWFKLTVLKTLPALALDVYMVVTFFDEKMFIVSFVLFCYLYRLYALWIAIELIKDIKTIDTDFIHPMYRDNP